NDVDPVGPVRTTFHPEMPTSLSGSKRPSYGWRSKKTVPLIVTVPVLGGGHFFARLASPVDDGLPGSLMQTFGLVGCVSCACETLATKVDMASASTTTVPRMIALLLMTRRPNGGTTTKLAQRTSTPDDP